MEDARSSSANNVVATRCAGDKLVPGSPSTRCAGDKLVPGSPSFKEQAQQMGPTSFHARTANKLRRQKNVINALEQRLAMAKLTSADLTEQEKVIIQSYRRHCQDERLLGKCVYSPAAANEQAKCLKDDAAFKLHRTLHKKRGTAVHDHRVLFGLTSKDNGEAESESGVDDVAGLEIRYKKTDLPQDSANEFFIGDCGEGCVSTGDEISGEEVPSEKKDFEDRLVQFYDEKVANLEEQLEFMRLRANQAEIQRDDLLIELQRFEEMVKQNPTECFKGVSGHSTDMCNNQPQDSCASTDDGSLSGLQATPSASTDERGRGKDGNTCEINSSGDECEVEHVSDRAAYFSGKDDDNMPYKQDGVLHVGTSNTILVRDTDCLPHKTEVCNDQPRGRWAATDFCNLSGLQATLSAGRAGSGKGKAGCTSEAHISGDECRVEHVSDRAPPEPHSFSDGDAQFGRNNIAYQDKAVAIRKFVVAKILEGFTMEEAIVAHQRCMGY